MKNIILLIAIIFSYNASAWDNEYKFSHIKAVDDFDYREVVEDYQGWSVVVFNKGYCPLNRTKMDCFPFEMKLNYMAPKIYARNINIQLVNMDTDFTFMHQRFGVKTRPAVVFLHNNSIMSVLESGSPFNANALLQRTLNEIYKIMQ